jgi:hypothetical protein
MRLHALEWQVSLEGKNYSEGVDGCQQGLIARGPVSRVLLPVMIIRTAPVRFTSPITRPADRRP